MTDVVDRAIADVMRRGGERITGINGTTRDGIMGIVRDTVSQGMDDGLGINEMYKNLEAALGNSYLFNDVRSELIARTETALAYNASALATYTEFGVQRVQAIDGDGDPECAARDGQDFSIEEAQGIEDHPNGTLDWVPFFEAAGQQPEDIAPPVEVTAASTPADIINANGTAPVSDAFASAIARAESSGVRNSKTVAEKIKTALATIEKTFTDGNLPSMPGIRAITNARSSLQGQYTQATVGGRKLPYILEFRGSAHLETVFHEITHFIDTQGLGFRGMSASRLGFARAQGLDLPAAATAQTAIEYEARAQVMEPVARAIIQSDGYGGLTRALADGEYVSRTQTPSGIRAFTDKLGQSEAKWVQYAIAPEEVYARAMGQYLAKRAGKKAVKEIDEALYRRLPGGTSIVDGRIISQPPGDYILDEAGRRIVKPLADQWDWEDFQAIDDAITAMLRNVGWLVE